MTEARNTLTNPRKRITAEINWFPGLGNNKVDAIVNTLEKRANIYEDTQSFSPIVQFNILYNTLYNTRTFTKEQLIKGLYTLANLYEEIDINTLLKIINEDRSVAGFTEITDISLIHIVEIQWN